MTDKPAIRRFGPPILLVIGVAIFLATVSAFGLGRLPFALRFALLLAYSSVAAVVARGCWHWASVSWTKNAGWASAPLIQAFLMTVPVATLVWAVATAFQRGAGAASYKKLLLMTFAVSSAVCLLRAAIIRGSAAIPQRTRTLGHLPVALRHSQLWAIGGEDHYVRFITDSGEALVHMRLSDAIADLDGSAGAQVHRSWWVAERGVDGVFRARERVVLRLKNGRQIPVSRTFRRTLRERGWF